MPEPRRPIRDLPPPMRASAAMVSERPEQPVWKEYFVYTADFIGAKALAAGTANGAPEVQAFDDFPIKIDSDSDFEWLKTIYFPTDARVYMRLQDDTSGRRLHRSTLDLRTAGGRGVDVSSLLANIEATAFLPFIEPDPYVVAAASVFTVSAADFSGSLNPTRISFHGTKIRPGWAPWQYNEAGQPRRFRARLPFKIVLPPDGQTFTVPANGSLNYAAPVDIEADFIIRRLTASHTGSALVTIQDGAGRERQWMDRAVEISLIAGNGIFPNIFPAPRYVYRGSTVTAVVQDLSGSPNRVRLTLHGDKLYE